MANYTKLQKEAKKQLKNDRQGRFSGNNKNPIIDRLKEKIEFIKAIESNGGKKEYKDIDEDKLYPLTLASSYIPVKDIKDGIIITRDGKFVKIIEISPVNFELKNERERRSIITAFEEYLRVAPAKIQIKCISKEASVIDLLQTIEVDKVNEQYEEVKEFYDDHKDFVKSLARNEAISRRFFLIAKYMPSNKVQANNFDEAKRQLNDVVETARKYLKGCGNDIFYDSEYLSHEQATILYEIFNRVKSSDIPFDIHMTQLESEWAEINGEETLDKIKARDYISPREIDFSNPKYVLIDGTYYAFMAIAANGYHQLNNPAWYSMFTNMGEGIDVDLFIEKFDRGTMSEKIYKSSKINRLRLRDARNSGDENGNVNNLDDAVNSGMYLREGLMAGQDFYYINTLITITADSLKFLEYKISEVKKYLKSKEFKVFNCYYMQEDAFNSYMPLLNLNSQIFRATRQNVLTHDLSYIYPFTSYELANTSGVMYGLSASNNSMVIIDNFDTRQFKNANMVLLGTSGAGKTYVLELIAKRQRLKHIPVCIIAPLKGYEYLRLCKKLQGSFITISPASDNCINIMEIREKDRSANIILDGEDVAESSLLFEKIQSLLIFFSILVPDITHEEKQLVDEEIEKTYNSFGITRDNASLFDQYGKMKTMPILGDLHARLDSNTGTKRVANILKRLVTGSARTFNQQTNVSLDNEYTVIDISELTGDMLLVGMFIAIDYVWSRAKEDRTKKKTIIIDELWKLLSSSSNELAAEYMLEIFKTIRGYGGSAIGATQDLVDFYALQNGKYGKGIINNSKIKIVLQLEHEEAKAVQNALNLTDAEIEKIESFDKGQAILISNNNNITVNIKASKMEHKYITTDRSELAKIIEESRAVQ